MAFKNIFKRLLNAQSEPPPGKLPSRASIKLEREPVKQEEPHACAEYTELKLIFRDIGRMDAIIETLGRDFLTAMPQGAYQSRLGHIAYLHRRRHEDLTNKHVRSLIDKAQEHEYAQSKDWDEWDSANLREMANMYLMNACVPSEIMERKARLSFAGRKQHQKVKKEGDWELAREFLTKQVELHREIAAARCKAFGEKSPYQMLMREHIPGMTVKQIEKLFTQHEEMLQKLLPEIESKQAKDVEPIPLTAQYEGPEQMWLNRSLLKVIGFDFDRGGLYETGHNPVEGGTPEDTRLVISNVDEDNFLDSMKSALHEGGHGLYIQGLPRKEWRYQPVAMDLGAGVHESQALLIEMIIGRKKEFFEFLSPRLEGLFHGMNAPDLASENLFSLKTRVTRTVDRKSADEVTYFYHALLRFRLERDLIAGDLEVDDLPQAWVEGIHGLLDILPADHMEGCLQDVHWFVGKFGYFPSYVIGHMLAAQLYEVLEKEIKHLKRKIEDGDFGDIKDWLIENIYSKGRLMSMHDLIEEVTGSPLKTNALERHLRMRYLG